MMRDDNEPLMFALAFVPRSLHSDTAAATAACAIEARSGYFHVPTLISSGGGGAVGRTCDVSEGSDIGIV